MVYKKFLFILLTVLFFLFLIWKNINSQSLPLVTVPYSIQNSVNLSNYSSYAIYKVQLINPTNHHIQYQFSVFSPDWLVLFGQNNEYKYGTLNPGQVLNVNLYLRPYNMTNQICEVFLDYRYENGTNIISYQLTFAPTVIYYHKFINTTLNIPLSINVIISNTTYYSGQNIEIKIIGLNKNNYTVNQSIEILSSWNYKKIINLKFKPGNNSYIEYLQIPYNLQQGYYNIDIISNNFENSYTIYILQPSINITSELPEIIYKNGKIIIYNPYNYSIYYEFIYNISQSSLSFFIINPKPSEIKYFNGMFELIYYIYLPPKESFEIIISPNYLLISLIAVLIIAMILLILFIFFIPVVKVKKRILKYNIKERKFTIEIEIKNKSFLPIYNIRIEDILPKDAEILNYEVVEPSRIYRDEKTRLIWNIEKLDRNGEIIISYTIKVPEDQKSIYLPSTRLRYEFTFRSIEANSNGLRISLI